MPRCEKLAKGTLNAYDLELLSNLWFCLYGAVRFQQLTQEEAQLEERYRTLIAELERLAREQDRPEYCPASRGAGPDGPAHAPSAQRRRNPDPI